MDKILLQIAAELKVRPAQVNAAVTLLDGGATVPFIAAIGVTTIVLWNAHRLAPLQLAGASACVLAMLWLVGWISERGESAPATVSVA